MNLKQKFILYISALAFLCFEGKARVVPEFALPSETERMLEDVPLEPMSEFMPSSSQSALPPLSEGRGPGTQFHLNDIKMDGQAITDPDLRKFLKRHIGKGVSWAYLKSLETGLTRYFRAKGWFLAQVTLPVQEISDGTVSYHLAPGYVTKVVYEGDKSQIDSVVESYVNKIKDNKPLTTKTLERYLLLLNDLPGMQAKINFSPSLKYSEASVMTVHLHRKKMDAALTVNNDGTQYVGPWQGMGQVSVNDAIFMEDKLTAGFGWSPAHRGMEMVRGNYEKYLGSEGLKLEVSGNHVKTRPGDFLQILEIEGTAEQGSVGLKYPMFRSRYQNLWIEGQVGFYNMSNEVGLLNVTTEDKIRTASATVSYDFSDVFCGKNLFEVGVRKGFRAFGATPNKSLTSSRPVGYTDFTKATLKALRVQALGKFQAIFLVQGQISSESLLNAERFSMGGGPYNRAYPSGVAIGDNGLFGRIELNYIFEKMGMVDHVIPYTYYTEGSVHNLSQGINEVSRRSVRSIGFGVRSSVASCLDGYIEYGIALKKKGYSEPVRSKISVGMTVKY